MPRSVPLKDFLSQPGPILDVRSPGEFLQGHIPESSSFPLFSDLERAQIGTAYKKQSRQTAVELGLLLLETKVEGLLNEAGALLNSSGKVLCWRGGMRSGFAARLLELLGFPMVTLQGGYKSYRRWAIQRLAASPPVQNKHLLFIVGGLTGSGKTAVLHALRDCGEQIIDLEALAHHRGSSFGGIGMPSQPTQEQFENKLAWQLEQMDDNRPIWLEDESRLIGRCHLPQALYQSMQQAPLFFLQISQNERLQNLLCQYGQANKDDLLIATVRIAKRLGSQLTGEIKQLIEQDKRELAFELLLNYYDRTYQYQTAQRQLIHMIPEKEHLQPSQWAFFLQQYYRQYYS